MSGEDGFYIHALRLDATEVVMGAYDISFRNEHNSNE